jgi:8-oxo-dGTP pyrophosphatase MutT (NUDIX family)
VNVPVRGASTVVIVRDGSDGLEVWLQQRSTSLVFAGGMHAFPGGAVDDDDASVSIGADVLDAHAPVWVEPRDRVSAFLAAAVRETFEECGVALAPEALRPWARWVTPPGPPRRFDAWFFVAAVPPGQQPAPLTGEVAEASWVVVRSAVEREAAGDLPMWPPTITTLTELAAFDSVAEVLEAAPRRIEAVTG